MLEIKNLTFSYPKQRQAVIDNMSLSIKEGGIYGLLGPNGAGKSTLLYLIAGLLTPKYGSAEVYGVNTRLRQPRTLSDIFLVPEEFDLPPVKISKYAKMMAPYYPHFSFQNLYDNFAIFDLDKEMNLSQLSMGQKKKAVMSLALAANTPLLLMDEPTNGLDIPSKSNFRRFIASNMSDDRSIIISTHQVRDIDQLLDHVIIMDNQKSLLNSSLYEVSRRLSFITTSNPELISRALYAIPDVMGASIILPNEDDSETPVNLELLFQFVTSRPDLTNQIFSQPPIFIDHDNI